MLLLSSNHIDTSTTMGITSIRNCSRDPNLFISIWLHLVCPNVHSSSPGIRYIIHCILKSTKELHFFSACLKSLGLNCAWMLLSRRTSSSYLMNSSQLLLLWWLVCTTFDCESSLTFPETICIALGLHCRGWHFNCMCVKKGYYYFDNALWHKSIISLYIINSIYSNQGYYFLVYFLCHIWHTRLQDSSPRPF